MVKKIAVTGGIGSGKSTLMRAFAKLGAPCLGADEIYSELLRNGDFVQKISKDVGVAPLNDGGVLRLDKKAVAEKVFSDKNALKKLNDLTHGEIMKTLLDCADTYDGVVFCEVPLLYEEGYEKLFDGVIVVFRDENARIKSIAERDGREEKQAAEIIKNQFDYSKIKKDGHTIFVENDGDEELLYEKAEKLVDMFEI